MSFDFPDSGGWEQTGVDDGALDRPRPRVPRIQRVPLRRFHSGLGTVEADRPVEAIVTEDESGFVAQIPSLHLFAAGTAVSDAVAALAEQVVHFFDFYTAARADQVIGEAAKLRITYLQQFRRAVAQAA